MEHEKVLIGIGYWHNVIEPGLPDPGNFVDERWNDEDRARVVKYMQSAFRMPYDWMGYSWCRFRCGATRLGTTEFTDGRYIWPEGLPHYIEKHQVRLPKEVESYMLTNRDIFPVKDEGFKIDWTWWLSQKGWNTMTTFNDLRDVGVLSVAQIHSMQKLKQGDLLSSYLIDSYGIKGRLEFVEKVLRGEQASVEGSFGDIAGFLSKLPAIGLRGEFERKATLDRYKAS